MTAHQLFLSKGLASAFLLSSFCFGGQVMLGGKRFRSALDLSGPSLVNSLMSLTTLGCSNPDTRKVHLQARWVFVEISSSLPP